MKHLNPLYILLFISAVINIYSRDNLLCVGYHWTEDEANLMMKKFALQWDDIDSWEKRTAAYNFFAHHLNLNHGNIPYEDAYKEDFVKVLSKDELKVFKDKDSRPENELLGIKAIIEYLNINQ